MYLVGNPDDKFFRDEAYVITPYNVNGPARDILLQIVNAQKSPLNSQPSSRFTFWSESSSSPRLRVC